MRESARFSPDIEDAIKRYSTRYVGRYHKAPDEKFAEQFHEVLQNYCDRKQLTPEDVMFDEEETREGVTPFDDFCFWAKSVKRFDPMKYIDDAGYSKDMDKEIKAKRKAAEEPDEDFDFEDFDKPAKKRRGRKPVKESLGSTMIDEPAYDDASSLIKQLWRKVGFPLAKGEVVDDNLVRFRTYGKPDLIEKMAGATAEECGWRIDGFEEDGSYVYFKPIDAMMESRGRRRLMKESGGNLRIVWSDRDSTTLSQVCPFCHKKYEFVVPMGEDEFCTAYLKYYDGELIQRAFPDLDVDTREYIKTGICNDCY